jgi:leader peptidase (prepilin peptidase) / N-methyltransferase
VEAAAAIALFIAGLAIGSFAGVVAHRVPVGESFATGRSRCDDCGATIGARDNVPVLSWILLRGRCRSCGAAIPGLYPLVELGLGAAYAATYLSLGGDDVGELVLGLVFATVLAIVTVSDLEYRVIPNPVMIAAAIAAIVIVAATDAGDLPEHLISGAAAGGFLLLIALLYPRGMGMGDVKLAGVMGLFLGSAVVPALIAGFLFGAIFGIALIARHGSEARKRAVPFGPFLALGGLIGLLAGNELIDWYLDTFLNG